MKNLFLTLLALVIVGCESPSMESLGEALFHEKALSLTQNQSCATCHNPEHGFIDDRDFDGDGFADAISRGDDNLSIGERNAPTAAYAKFSPTFARLSDGNYSGGQFHDGRAATLEAQAGGPPLNPVEMMMSDKASVVARIQANSDYVTRFKKLFGESVFDSVDNSYNAMETAIATFERSTVFAPFDSKYDRYLACKALGKSTNTCYIEGNWSSSEQLGYALFFSLNNTNCVQCHSLNSASEASQKEIFTNHQYFNIGTPANPELNLGTPDLGLGGALNASAHYGKFKVPTLRNIAVTAPYMHNGVFKELTTVIKFYDHMAGNGEANNPETNATWGAPEVNSTISELLTMNDLTDAKIDALVAFLKTLTDARYEHLLE